jgi:predicted RNA-binding protein
LEEPLVEDMSEVETLSVGMRMVKVFGEHGDFEGEVLAYDAANMWWRVRYSDGEVRARPDKAGPPFLVFLSL